MFTGSTYTIICKKANVPTHLRSLLPCLRGCGAHNSQADAVLVLRLPAEVPR